MADLFVLSGGYSTNPASGSPSGFAALVAPIEEQFSLSKKHLDDLTLGADAPVALSFGGVTNANAVIIKSRGGKIRVRLTSSDGAVQSVPCDSFVTLLSMSVPFTAIDVTRVAGTSTDVEYFLGEKSS